MNHFDNETLKESLRLTLEWFEQSGVMSPADGSWGVAERIVLKSENSELEKIKKSFPPWEEKEEYLILEHRRADCAMQTAMLYQLAAEALDDPEKLRIAHNLLRFLFCRSGLLRTSAWPGELPTGLWNWDHSRRCHQYYFDDNSWMCALLLMTAEKHPDWDAEFQLKEWALKLACAMAEKFPCYLSGELSEKEIAGDMKWLGNVFKPHWGSLVVMALSRAAEFVPDPRFRAIVDSYHDYLLAHPESFNTSEWSYAVIGSSFARHAFHDEKSPLVMRLFGRKLAASVAANGLIPSQHEAEAPAGTKLADLIYTMNFATLALESLAAFDPAEFQAPADRLMRVLLTLQDRSPEPYLHGCRRGMFDFEHNKWGGGNCSEGGAASIYTGWTNAPIAWAIAGRMLHHTIENF